MYYPPECTIGLILGIGKKVLRNISETKSKLSVFLGGYKKH